MTITAKDYALLCQDSYNSHKDQDIPTLGGIKYEILTQYSNPISGYQGVAYQRVDTGEVVLVNRGTELSGPDALTDIGMVASGLNAQLIDARAFAHVVEQKATERAQAKGYALPPITVSGHSLGGTLAELLAHDLQWQGTTFNAYGAVDLGYDIPRGGDQVINYVRATDVVSAASHHFGKVVTLATAEDVEQLDRYGYDDTVTADSLRNPVGAISFAAHSIDNFIDMRGRPSDLSAENEVRARAHSKAIALYREDVQSLRSNILSLSWELQHKELTAAKLWAQSINTVLHGDIDKAATISELSWKRTVDNLSHAAGTVGHTAKLGITVIDHVGAAIAEPIRHAAQTSAHYAGEALHTFNTAGAQHLEKQQSLIDSLAITPRHQPSALRLDDPTHPDHALFLQAREGVHKLDQQHGHTNQVRSDQLAAALTVEARRHHYYGITKVFLSQDRQQVHAYDDSSVFSPPSPIRVNTVDALNTPIEHSSQQWHQTMQAHTEEQARQRTPMQTHSQGMSR